MAEPDKPQQPNKAALAAGKTLPPDETNDQLADLDPADLSEPSALEQTAVADSDPQTDKAVDDIMKNDGDEVLHAQDESAERAVVMKQGHWEHFKNSVIAFWSSPRKRNTATGVVILLLAALLVVPYTRYNILGLVLKAPVTVEVVDNKNGSPVSGASVSLAGQTVVTEANGKAVLRVHAGSKRLQISKKYYGGYTHGKLVALSASHNNFKVPLVALGRQVSLKVVNKISGKPVAGAVVNAEGSNTKTDGNGVASIVLPSSADKQSADISQDGYNTLKIQIAAAGNLAQNTFSIAPAGKLYFLSNLSGSIDVVKTNLDGTDRQTVLAGTGSEDTNSTSLLASRDWKYLALLSRRSGDKASVYLIDTTNADKLTTIDQGNATFSFVGWSGDRFVYQVTRGTVPDWQTNQQALKSLDATTGQTLLLDQTAGSGTSQNDFAKQFFNNPYIINNQVVYIKGWSSSYNSATLLAGKQAELNSIGADGSGPKKIKTFAADTGTQTTYIAPVAQLYEPNSLYVAFSGGSTDSFYDYEDGKVTEDTTMTSAKFYQTPYPTFLLSPSGNATFWAEQRDGKNTLFTGDQNGKNQKQIAALSPYTTYGWFTDNYLLVSKGSSELYIMSSSGGTPFKITDYYKPAINYNGYGGGYGGL